MGGRILSVFMLHQRETPRSSCQTRKHLGCTSAAIRKQNYPSETPTRVCESKENFPKLFNDFFKHFSKICSKTFQALFKDISKTFQNLSKALRNLRGTLRNLRGTLRNLRRTLRNLRGTFAEPCGTLRNLRGTLRNLPSKGNP